MDFDLRQYDAFRDDVEAWVRTRTPSGSFAHRRGSEGRETLLIEKRSIQRDLGSRGWLCGGWPVAFGGGGWPKVKQAVFNELAAYRGVPGTGRDNVGVSTIGPILMIYGSDEQKQTLLPQIAGGEITWSQGYSEPNAGSDLASLQTRAVADGDDFVINGSKIWNHSKFVDYIFLLARTDPASAKHRGITQFVLPRKTPGITIQPILDAYGDERWTLLTLEDVRLPRSAVVGEVNKGWYQSATSLDFERSQMAYVGTARRSFDAVLQYAKTAKRGGTLLIDHPFIRDRIGDLAVQVEMARWLSYRVAYLQDTGSTQTADFSRSASMAKVWACETQQRIERYGVELSGATGFFSAGSEWAAEHGLFDEQYWAAPGITFAGGASEIQRNVIAQRGLGLPR